MLCLWHESYVLFFSIEPEKHEELWSLEKDGKSHHLTGFILNGFFWSVDTTAEELTRQVTTPIDLDCCTPVGAGSLGLRLCRICTSEEDKWLIFWDSFHTRGRNGGSNWRKLSPLVPISKSTHCCTGSEAGQKSHHVLPYLSLPAALAALQMPTLHQVRPADASSKSMPQGLCQHASPISCPHSLPKH